MGQLRVSLRIVEIIHPISTYHPLSAPFSTSFSLPYTGKSHPPRLLHKGLRDVEFRVPQWKTRKGLLWRSLDQDRRRIPDYGIIQARNVHSFLGHNAISVRFWCTCLWTHKPLCMPNFFISWRFFGRTHIPFTSTLGSLFGVAASGGSMRSTFLKRGAAPLGFALAGQPGSCVRMSCCRCASFFNPVFILSQSTRNFA